MATYIDNNMVNAWKSSTGFSEEIIFTVRYFR